MVRPEVRINYDVRHPNFVGGFEKYGPLDNVSQLSGVSGPVMSLESLDSQGGNAGNLVVLFGAEGGDLEEVLSEGRDVSFSIWRAEGFNQDWADAEAIEEVASETAGLDFVMEVPVARCDDCGFAADGFCAADLSEILFLDYPE